MKGLFLVVCLCLTQYMVQGQVKQYYHKDPEGMLEQQSKILFEQAYKILDAYPPDTLQVDERKLALSALDGLLHDTRLDTSRAVKNYFKGNVDRIIDSLGKNTADRGVRIFKVYNHGFILKSKSVTIAIDIVRGGRYKYIDEDQIQKLVDLSDILFVSHYHGDHADPMVAEMFVRQGKKVIVPSGLWENKSDGYIHLRNTNSYLTTTIELDRRRKLGVDVFPGHQKDVLNNIYAITLPESITITHTGDQSNKNDLSWIKEMKNRVTTDVLLLHCWTPNLKEVVEGIDPRLIVTGHENELGHSIDHREPYWLTYEKMKAVSKPYIIMAWGEIYHYK